MLKPERIRTLSLGSEAVDAGSGRRERTTTEVMVELRRHWESTSLPIMPVEPVSIIFMLRMRFSGASSEGGGGGGSNLSERRRVEENLYFISKGRSDQRWRYYKQIPSSNVTINNKRPCLSYNIIISQHKPNAEDTISPTPTNTEWFIKLSWVYNVVYGRCSNYGGVNK